MNKGELWRWQEKAETIPGENLPEPVDKPPEIGPMTDVHPSVNIGVNTKVWPFATICRGVVIGRDCAIGARAYIGKNTFIGDNTRIQDGAHITDHMVIGHNVFIGPGVVTLNDKYPRANNPWYKVEPPTIDSDAGIGGGAVLLPGVRIGKGAIVGAGAVVTKDVPEGMTVVGNPAKELIKSRT